MSRVLRERERKWEICRLLAMRNKGIRQLSVGMFVKFLIIKYLYSHMRLLNINPYHPSGTYMARKQVALRLPPTFPWVETNMNRSDSHAA